MIQDISKHLLLSQLENSFKTFFLSIIVVFNLRLEYAYVFHKSSLKICLSENIQTNKFYDFKICLVFSKYEPRYAYKRYAYKRKNMYLDSSIII